MQHLTKALIAGGVAVAAAAGFVIGRIFGKSEAETRIQELLREVQKLHDLNVSREEEIAALRMKLQSLADEVVAIRKASGVLKRFVRWVGTESPEIVERFRAMEVASHRVEELHQDQQRDCQALDARVQELRTLFPKEMERLEVEFVRGALGDGRNS